jgi:hypothetical protein
MVSLAAIVGEKMFFEEDNSSGVISDLHSATTIAMAMEGYWGMGESVASHAASKPTAAAAMQLNDVSRNVLETDFGRRVERILAGIVERTRSVLEQNRLEVLAVAHALEAHKTLTGDDVIAVVEGHVGPLIDGRPYRTPQFRELVENYHAKAVAAHKQQGKVELPLPVLTSVGSDGANVASRPYDFDDGSAARSDPTDGQT